VTDRAWILDVGQGHATLAVSGDRALVIDCPTGRDGIVRDRLVDENAVLEHVFITHRDLDHCGGIPSLLGDPGATHVHMHMGFAVPPQSDAKVRVKAVLSSIFSIVDRDGLHLSHGESAGAVGDLGSIGWRVLSPSAAMVGQAALSDTTNRASMVILLESTGTRVLVTGDADDVAIQRLGESTGEMEVDVLLVPHHGATLARLSELVRLTQPSVAVISAGRSNPYGHPHSSTLLELASNDEIRLVCTEVSKQCHVGDLEHASCAGSLCVEFGGDPIVVGSGEHDARIGELEWPICAKGALRP
jgi:competence protein ComEC